jgi:hypothetical protein
VNELVRFAMVAFYPRVGDMPGLAELGVEEKIARLRRESTLLFWTGVVAAAVFFHLSPILTVRRLGPAGLLSEVELDAHANRLATHPSYFVRQIVVLLKLMAGVFWGESPEIRAKMNLPAYGRDPATRRLEARVAPPAVVTPRAPGPALVALGKREVEKGRPGDHVHGLTADAHPAPREVG